MNPFQHGIVVTGEDFCPRPALIAALRGHIASHQNCVIRGGRRMGKTSAVMEAIAGLRKKTGHLMVNCWGKSSVGALIEAISEAFLIHQSKKGMFLETLLKSFIHLRPVVTVDPATGEPSFSFDIQNRDNLDPRSIETVLAAIGREAEKQPLVVVFDEFQAVMNLPRFDEVLATLRGAIQMQPKATYFYLGSIRNVMDDLFNNPAQPFFKSAASVSVGPIDRETYSGYLRGRFERGRRKISDGILRQVFDITSDIAGDVQQFCSEIWNCSNRGETVSTQTVDRALKRIHHSEHESNSRIVDLLTPGQVKVLLGLAKVGGRQPSSEEFLKASGVRQPSSVSAALNRLTREGLIYRDASGYHFFSPFFRTWLIETL